MTTKLSDFVNLSPLAAALVVVLGRLPVPARYLDDDRLDDRVEPSLDETRAVALPSRHDAEVLPYIADDDAA